MNHRTTRMVSHSVESADSAFARSEVYGFLATAFHGGISGEFLDHLTSPVFLNDVKISLGDGEALRLFNDFSESYDGNPEPYRLEYNTLFVVPGGKYLTPYESVYCDAKSDESGGAPEGTLMGPSTLSVLDFYAKTGAELPADYSEMPDHIAAELEFMRYLCETEAQALKEGKEDVASDYAAVQQRFLSEHLTRWIPSLFAQMKKRTKSSLWLGLAYLCQQFCESDLEAFDK